WVFRGQNFARLEMLQHEFQPDTRDELETRDLAACHAAREVEQIESRARRSKADKGGLDRAGFRKEFEDRRGDDSECAFRANKQIFEIVAGVVFFELRQ